MPTKQKPPKKTITSLAGRVMSNPKKAAAPSERHGEYIISPRQLKQADKMLVHIERRGEALSATANRLLKRVS